MEHLLGKKKQHSSNLLCITEKDGDKKQKSSKEVDDSDILQEELYQIYLKDNCYDFTFESNTKPVSVYEFFRNSNYKGEVTFSNEATHRFGINNINAMEHKVNCIVNPTDNNTTNCKR